MKLQVCQYTQQQGWNPLPDIQHNSKNTLLIFFGTADSEAVLPLLKDLEKDFPDSVLMGCSSAGEIYNEELFDDSISLAIIKFDSASIKFASTTLNEVTDSTTAGRQLAEALMQPDIKSIFVLSDGLLVNGSRLVEGLTSVTGKKVTITGGLAGDGDRFGQTWVWADGKPQTGMVTAVGLYGEKLQLSHGSRGGWDMLGPEREVTHAVENVLYELDGQPALELYKKYLGDRADELPASGLLFPLSIRNEDKQDGDTVRTILAVDEDANSITFAGNVPTGSYVRLMRANFDRLIDGAVDAAAGLDVTQYQQGDLLSIAISCVGRRLVLGNRTEDELEATLEELPSGCKQIGFYSYGEISPLASGTCDLHNQTMTLSLIWENN